MMEAIRIKTTPVNSRVTVDIPSDMDGQEVEVIILANERADRNRETFRKPPSELSDTVITDDLITPAVPAEEWDALK